MSESNPLTDTVVSTLVSLDTSANSIIAGGAAAGATSGTGGFKGGVLAVTGNVSDGTGTLAAVRAGGIGIAAQAAGDTIYAATATQLGRLAIGGPLTATRNNATATALEQAAISVRYTATLANVLNTVANTVTCSFSVPANLMADGDRIHIGMAALLKNNKGSAGTPQWQLLWGATASSQIAVGTAWPNSASEFKVFTDFLLQRVGADIWIFFPAAGNGSDNSPIMMPWQWGTTAPGNSTATLISAPTFTSAQTFSVKLQLDAADATYYYKPQSALVRHLR